MRAAVDGREHRHARGRHHGVDGQGGDAQREAEGRADAPQGDARDREQVVRREGHEQQAHDRAGPRSFPLPTLAALLSPALLGPATV